MANDDIADGCSYCERRDNISECNDYKCSVKESWYVDYIKRDMDLQLRVSLENQVKLMKRIDQMKVDIANGLAKLYQGKEDIYQVIEGTYNHEN
jgi:histidinol phosphatase-like enzyme